MALHGGQPADFDGDGLLDLPSSRAWNQASSMTTIYGRPSNSSSRATPLGWFCTRTRGRARLSQPCGEPAPRSSPADAFPADEVVAALDAIESADVGA